MKWTLQIIFKFDGIAWFQFMVLRQRRSTVLFMQFCKSLECKILEFRFVLVFFLFLLHSNVSARVLFTFACVVIFRAQISINILQSPNIVLQCNYRAHIQNGHFKFFLSIFVSLLLCVATFGPVFHWQCVRWRQIWRRLSYINVYKEIIVCCLSWIHVTQHAIQMMGQSCEVDHALYHTF